MKIDAKNVQEKDIYFLFIQEFSSNNQFRHALLIENKINAVTMPKQSSRHIQRGEL